MTVKILFVSKMILRSNLIILCLDSVMYLFLLKHVYLRNFVIRFSAVSYGTYSIEALVNLTFYGVKRLVGYGIFLTLLRATYFRHLLSVIISVLFNDFTFQFNYFLSRFRNVSISLKIHLFKNVCYSFFGSQLRDLQHSLEALVN